MVCPFCKIGPVWRDQTGIYRCLNGHSWACTPADVTIVVGQLGEKK